MTPDSVDVFELDSAREFVTGVVPWPRILPWVDARGGGEPTDSPLKVWTGSEWVPAGISVDD